MLCCDDDDGELDFTGPPGPAVLEDEYPDYDSGNSRVVSGPLGAARFPGTRFAKYQQAQAYCNERYNVIKFWTLGPRWFCRIRVPRVCPPGGSLMGGTGSEPGDTCE